MKPLFTYEQEKEKVGVVDPAPPFVIEGPVATVVRIPPGAYLESSNHFYFVYRTGGALTVDLGVCTAPWGITGDLTENPHFSEDWKTSFVIL